MTLTLERTKRFTLEEISILLLEIENNNHSELCFDCIPQHPREHQIFLYKCKSKHDTDFRSDGYIWKHNSSATIGLVKRSYYKIKNLNLEFNKTIDMLANPKYPENQPVIITYSGNHEAYDPRPHRAAKYKTTPYQTTRKSVKSEIESLYDPLAQNQTQDIYHKIEARDKKQVENFIFQINKNHKLYTCPIKSTIEIAKQSTIIWDFQLYPNLSIVFGDNRFFPIFKSVLSSNEKIILEYDTTFNLGDFYLSYIISPNPFLRNTVKSQTSPKFPLIYLIHRKKHQSVHETLLRCFKRKLLQHDILFEEKIFFATDREQGILNAIRNVFPKNGNVFCCNHIYRNIQFWIKQNNIVHGNVEELLRSPDNIQCWPEEFQDYFDKFVLPDLSSNLKHFPNEYITTNGIERFNRTIKDWTNHKELDIDRFLMVMQCLNTFYLNQFEKAFCGQGEYEFINNSRYPEIESAIYNLNSLIHTYKSNMTKPIEYEDKVQWHLAKSAKITYLDGVFFVNHWGTVNSVYYKTDQFICSCEAGICFHIIAVQANTGFVSTATKNVKLIPLLQKGKKHKSGRKKCVKALTEL